MRCLQLLPLFGLLWLASACNETPKIPPAVIDGRWELLEGMRAQKATETLAGVYFLFDPATGTMETNLPVGAETPTPFERKDNKIIQKSAPPVEYEITGASDSTLNLSFEIRGIPFDLKLRKASLMPPADSLQ
jgi:hypothetical protein